MDNIGTVIGWIGIAGILVTWGLAMLSNPRGPSTLGMLQLECASWVFLFVGAVIDLNLANLWSVASVIIATIVLAISMYQLINHIKPD